MCTFILWNLNTFWFCTAVVLIIRILYVLITKMISISNSFFYIAYAPKKGTTTATTTTTTTTTNNNNNNKNTRSLHQQPSIFNSHKSSNHHCLRALFGLLKHLHIAMPHRWGSQLCHQPTVGVQTFGSRVPHNFCRDNVHM